MKKIIFTFLAISLFIGCASSRKLVTGTSFVIEHPLSKKKLFQKIELWVHDSFKSGKSVIELKDLEQGIIIGNGRFPYSIFNLLTSLTSLSSALSTNTRPSEVKSVSTEDFCLFKFKILVKDNKAKIELYQFDLVTSPDYNLNDVKILKFQNELNESLVSFLNKNETDF